MNSRHYSLNLFDILIEVTHKKIKHLHLRISSPEGKVTVSAPMRMSEETIRIFCMSKLEWMCASREKFKNRKQEEPKQYLSGEVHSYLGKNYVLEVTEQDTRPKIYLDGEILKFSVRPDTTTEKKETLLHDWYKEQLGELLKSFIENAEKIMNVHIKEIRFRKMKTKWGTCNPRLKRILLNTELAKKSIKSIEYVLIHEMVHLLERGHNARFHAYMDRFFPTWRVQKAELNSLAMGYGESEKGDVT